MLTTTSVNHVVSDFPGVDELFRQLARIDGKAEIVDGGIVIMSPTGAWPSLVALNIATDLLKFARQTRQGLAVGDSATFRVDLPHRLSFSPDAAYFTGPPAQMGPFEGAPVFAVEVRSFGDYGTRAERLLAEKRDDYFACGTLVVWDVDLQSRDVIRSFAAASRNNPVIFRPGDIAHAEPAVPGWTVSVDELLPENWTPPAAESRQN